MRLPSIETRKWARPRSWPSFIDADVVQRDLTTSRTRSLPPCLVRAFNRRVWDEVPVLRQRAVSVKLSDLSRRMRVNHDPPQSMYVADSAINEKVPQGLLVPFFICDITSAHLQFKRWLSWGMGYGPQHLAGL